MFVEGRVTGKSADVGRAVSLLTTLNEDFTNYKTRRITEAHFNAKFPDIPDTALKRLVRRKLPTLDSRRVANVRHPETHSLALSTSLSSIVQRLALLDEPDARRRLDIFLGYCRLKEFAPGTVRTYFQGLRRAGLFVDAEALDAARAGAQGVVAEGSSVAGIRPDWMAFGDLGRRHTRSVSLESFARLLNHLSGNFSRFTAPLLVAMYTGLRTAEILQWSAHTLAQLSAREPIVSIMRKNTVSFAPRRRPDPQRDESLDDSADESASQAEYWRPVYNTYLCDFARRMQELYASECLVYSEQGIDARLFPLSRSVLLNRIKTEYTRANEGRRPPFGFGIHSCRNMIARVMMSTSESLTAVQGFLQHRSVRTTRKYINSDYAETAREFDRLTSEELASTRRLLPAE